uniref:Uncharacterized protein n=1 Tax=Moniliophthora roreri TaxID=221103 RepID=A0A0W0FI61_MONRR
MKNVYKRRKSLQEDQFAYLKNQRFPKPICNLFCHPQSVSKDEWDPEKQCYWIKSKPECAEKVTAFTRKINKHNLQNKQLRQASTTKPHDCTVLDTSIEPAIPSIPSSQTPIDYFDPMWFNKRNAKICKEYLGRVPTIALPNRWKDKFFRNPDEAAHWKKMPLHDFMIQEELKNMVGYDDKEAPDIDLELTEEQKKQAELLKKLHNHEKSKGKGKDRANVDDEYKDLEEHADLGQLKSKKKKPEKPHVSHDADINVNVNG